MRFAVEDAAGVAGCAQSAGIGTEAGFKHEADLEVRADFFHAAQTPTGTELLAFFHRELVLRFSSVVVAVAAREHQSGVDQTVDFDIGRSRRAGNERAEHRHGDQRLFHLLFLLWVEDL